MAKRFRLLRNNEIPNTTNYYIDVDVLKRGRACSYGRRAFKKVFGKEPVQLTLENIKSFYKEASDWDSDSPLRGYEYWLVDALSDRIYEEAKKKNIGKNEWNWYWNKDLFHINSELEQAIDRATSYSDDSLGLYRSVVRLANLLEQVRQFPQQEATNG